ncbi:MAG: hypothetical protein J5677_03140 [Bacteroidales bacterium]|nr:hypothetical protein [Bacteroidales bacterium]
MKKIWIHAAFIVAMLIVSLVYFLPALEGKVIVQGDIQKYEAMAKMQKDAREATGSMSNWAPGMFSGMPGYQITGEPQHSVFQPVRDTLTLTHLGWQRNIGVLFLYLLGFYVAMLAFGISPWLALIGALGFGLGSYNLIIIEAGHITKAWAMGMMAPVLAGMWLTMRSAIDKTINSSTRTHRVLWGVVLFTIALIIQIGCNHIQITFYTALACVIMGIGYLVYAIIKKRVKGMLTVTVLLIVGAGLAFGSNARTLLVNEEYAKYTMRGGNELTVTPADLYGESEGALNTGAQNTATGLDINYAFSWSYGVGETYTLLVPGSMGGGSGERMSTESSFYKTFHSEQAPLYWGNQPFTSGPVYFGAIIILLFVMGMIVTKGPERWWILAASVLAILLSWGHNLPGFNGWVFNHIPLYNKFRTPSMALVLANVCMVILAVLALKTVFDKERDRKAINRGLYIATGVVGGLILLVLVLSGSFSYSGSSDQQMAAQYGSQWDMIKSVLVSDRAALLRSDSWRSLLFVVLTGVVLWLYNNEKLKKAWIAIALIGILVVIDLWGVDRRYLNEENFVEKSQTELRRDQWDYDLDQMAAQYGDKNYRVLNLAVNTFNDSKPSAFHQQIGGYSAAKLSRYQNLIDFYLSRRIKPEVLAMLNTRYVVMQNGQVQRLPEALGNCWFVQSVKAVGNANEEILALNEINPATTAVVNTHEFKLEHSEFGMDSTASIVLESTTPYNPDYMRYRSHSSHEQLAVFSEIHYAPDWFAYIDGKPAEYIRANYVLRAMVIPAGDHVIEFKNEAPRMHRLDTVTLIISIVTLLIMIGAIVLVYRRKKEEA